MSEIIKVLCIGDGGCGKTTYLKKLKTGQFEEKYIPTIGIEVYTHNEGNIIYNYWDCAGQERYSGLKDGYYYKTDIFYIFFECNSKIHITNLKYWIQSILQVNDNAKIKLIGTKSDLENPRNTKYLQQVLKYGYPISIISSKYDKNMNLINL
jgi:GTP-binding nuclear protein Ran